MSKPREIRAAAPRDFPRDKILTAARRFVIVTDSVAHKKPVRFSINAAKLRCEGLSASVRTRRTHRRLFRLRRFRCIAENFRRRRVIKSHRLSLITHDLEKVQRRHPRFIASRLGKLEAQTDVALTGQMINLTWQDLAKDASQGRRVR